MIAAGFVVYGVLLGRLRSKSGGHGTANLVIEEVFVNVQCQSKQREQTPSQRDNGMAKNGGNGSDQRLEARRFKTDTNSPPLCL